MTPYVRSINSKKAHYQLNKPHDKSTKVFSNHIFIINSVKYLPHVRVIKKDKRHN